LIDFRLYRLAFAPTLVAVIAVMFSLEGAPAALEPAGPPGTFDADAATATARHIATDIPGREPGSPGDEETADLVAQSFDEVAAGAVSEQRFDADYNGDQVSLRNVLLTLPGDGASTIVVTAPRDSADPPGAASSAAATGILLELARSLGERQHERTFVVASTSGSEAGEAGIRELIDGIADRGSIEAVVVVSQPGAADPSAPYVVDSSSGKTSAPIQLDLTAERAVGTQAGLTAEEEPAFTQLARLAIPSGLGEQAPLIADGVDAVAISSAGERPLATADDQLDDLATQSVDAFGRSIQSAIGALDVADGAVVHGPSAHIELGRNLVPGWALATLALALLLPAGVAAVDGCARALRGRAGLRAGLAWGASRSVPFVGALAILYALVLVGLVPNPPFPFDPGVYPTGARGAVTFALVVGVAVASAFALRFRRSAPAVGEAAIPALGALTAAAGLVLWLANPYLALLLVPAAHVWLLAAGRPGAVGRAVRALVTLAAWAPAVAAAAAVAVALELGAAAPWTMTLMVADGQIGLGVTLPLCFLAGALAGTLVLLVRAHATANAGV
jgi:hypothetical protein